MKFKKILAGFMGIAMTLSLLPCIANAALPAGYRFYEGFEDATYITQAEISGCNRLWGFPRGNAKNDYWKATWKNAPGADGQNGYIEYERNNSANYDRSGSNLAVFQLYDGSTPFEVGYKFKPGSGGLTCSYRNIFTVVPAVGDTRGTAPAVQYDNSNGFTLNGDTATSIKNVTDWVTVKVLINPLDKTVTTSMSYGGKEVSKTVANTSAPHGFWMTLECAWDNPNDTNKDVIMLDEVYAKALPQRVVSFNTNGGSNVSEIKTLTDKITLPKDPTKSGHVFEGWYKDEKLTQKFDGTGVPESGMTAYAKWLKEYTITYNTGTEEVKVKDGKAVEGTGTTVLPNTVDLVRSGYHFEGWYKDEELTQKFDGTGITTDITVYANWITAHEIEFRAPDADSDKDKLIKRYAVAKLEEEEIPTPVRLGWQFDGYFLMDGETVTDTQFTKDTVVTGATKVQAKWTKQWAVDFETGAGSAVERIYTLEDIDIDTLDEPTLLGGGFEGWYTDKELTTLWDGSVSGDMTVWAKWNNIVKKITFDEADGVEFGDTMLLEIFRNSRANFEAAKEAGSGVVPYNGSNAFKLPVVLSNNSTAAVIPFGNAGEGVYEISFRMTTNFGISWLQAGLMTPQNGDTKIVKDLSWGDHGITFSNNADASVSLGKPGDTVVKTKFSDVLYIVDTVYNTVRIKMTHYDDKDTPLPTTEKTIAFDTGVEVDGIDRVLIGGILDRNSSTDCYIDDIVIRKITPPTLESVTIGGKAVDLADADTMYDVSTDAAMTMTFSEELNSASVTSSSIYITEADNKENIVLADVTLGGDKKSATVKPRTSLIRGKKYILNITKGIDNGRHLLDNNYTFEFVTVPNKFYYEAEITDPDGNRFTNGLSGKDVMITVKLRNHLSENDPQDYYVSAILKGADNQLIGYISASGKLSKAEGLQTVIDNVKFANRNTSLNSNCKVEIFIWDGATTMNNLWEEAIVLK